MLDLIVSPQQNSFGQAKRDTLTRYCRDCDVLAVCNGGCPKDRFVISPDGEAGLHYLCPSYQASFHLREPILTMSGLLRAGRARPPKSWIFTPRLTPGAAAMSRVRAGRGANGSAATAARSQADGRACAGQRGSGIGSTSGWACGSTRLRA
jgi:hypothetical protein